MGAINVRAIRIVYILAIDETRLKYTRGARNVRLWLEGHQLYICF